MNTNAVSTFKSMSPQLLVSDLSRSVNFYTSKLGFEISFRYSDFYVGIVKDGFSIHLKSGTPATDERNIKGTDEKVDLLFSVEDIDNLYKDILNKSVEVIQPLREMPYGREFYINDPDRNTIAFIEAS
jgi:predicted enzyme related to lactoylglutathione lyase